MSAKAQETAWLTEGPLNAMVIQTGEPKGLIAAIRRMVETTGGLPCSAASEMQRHHEAVVSSESLHAKAVGEAACEVSDANIEVKSRRVGAPRESKSVLVSFSCGVPEGECCRKGLIAAKTSMESKAEKAKAKVDADPLSQFQTI